MTARRALVAALVFAIALPAAAYVRSKSDTTGAPLFWPTPTVPYVVSSHAAFQSPSCLAGGGDGPALDAVTASFAEWEQSCSVLKLVYGGRIDDTRIGLPTQGEHLVVFRQGFCSQNPDAVASGCMTDANVDCGNQFDCFEDSGGMTRNVVALTSVLYEPSSGRIVDADIEVNAWDGKVPGTSLTAGAGGPAHGWYFTCAKAQGWPECASYGDANCYYIDLQNTVTHEVGHFVGLAHVCETQQGNCTPAMTPLTMYPATSPGDTAKRTLEQDDIDGVCAIYPERHSSSGGCGSAGGAPAATALLLAAAALWRRRRGVTRSP